MADCASCIRWRRLVRKDRRVSRYGACMAPAWGPRPYWEEAHPTGDLLVADVHGKDCPAFKPKRR